MGQNRYRGHGAVTILVLASLLWWNGRKSYGKGIYTASVAVAGVSP